jgi:hypothetical protein
VTLSQRVGKRFQESDAFHILLGYLALSVVVLLFAWPSHDLDPNNSWFSLVQIKATFTAFVALSYGAALIDKPWEEGLVFMLSLLGLLVLTLPLEAIAYMTSFPPLPPWWAPLVQALLIPAFFTLGLGLGWLLARLHLTVLAPLMSVLALVGAFFFDLRFDVTLLNPARAALDVSPMHLALTASLLVLYGMMSLRHFRRETGREAQA